MSNKDESQKVLLEGIDCARLDQTHFVAPHFNARANLIADFARAGEALLMCAGQLGWIWKTPVQSLGHAAKMGQLCALLSSQTVIA